MNVFPLRLPDYRAHFPFSVYLLRKEPYQLLDRPVLRRLELLHPLYGRKVFSRLLNQEHPSPDQDYKTRDNHQPSNFLLGWQQLRAPPFLPLGKILELPSKHYLSPLSLPYWIQLFQLFLLFLSFLKNQKFP